jgi:hypothetical protein
MAAVGEGGNTIAVCVEECIYVRWFRGCRVGKFCCRRCGIDAVFFASHTKLGERNVGNYGTNLNSLTGRRGKEINSASVLPVAVIP